MIIKCEKCQTRFRLDDARVTDKGVKVRCTKCKNVFRVYREEPEEAALEPGDVLTGFSPHVVKGEAATEQQLAAESVPGFQFDSEAWGDSSSRSEPDVASSFETSPFDASPETVNQHIGGEVNVSAAAEATLSGGEVDFSGYDFGDSDSESDSITLAAAPADDFTAVEIEPAPAAPRKEVPQGLDFSDDDMFGAVVQAAPEAPSGTITFDFEGDSFAESMDMSGLDSGGKRDTLFSLDTHGDAPFSLGEIDFGDELTSVAVQQVNPDDLKPAQEILFAPLAEARNKAADNDLTRAFFGVDDNAEQQELPPLSIASRRKQSPLFSALVALIALLALSVLGYLGYSSFYTPRETAATDSGKIAVRAVKAAFIKNEVVGELLVISGEALNEYAKPRAALQVKVTVFDAAGQIIATKNAYCGNPLPQEQLVSLALDKIEAAMANQFGDSLANMEVASGKAIPFVVALANLPKGAKDFLVQPAGSTVAAGKQP